MTGKRLYLEALGIPLWLPRSNHPGSARHPSLAKEENREDASSPENPLSYQRGCTALGPSLNPASPSLPHPNFPPPEEKKLSGEDSSQHLLPPSDGWSPPMDDNWEPVFDIDATGLPAVPPGISREAHIAQMDWEKLTAEARQCTACELCATRTQVVFGVGNRQAEWLVIGEAPGADEDRQGEPFVGRAGQLLNPMLLAIGLQREHVYIANILKCRPPENREPAPAEAMKCRPFLERQITLIQPRIILAVGRIAAQNLLDRKSVV